MNAFSEFAQGSDAWLGVHQSLGATVASKNRLRCEQCGHREDLYDIRRMGRAHR